LQHGGGRLARVGRQRGPRVRDGRVARPVGWAAARAARGGALAGRGVATAMSGLKEQLRSLRIERDGAAAAQPAVRRGRARSVLALGAVIALVGFAAVRWITAPLGVHVVYSRAPSGDQPISGPVLSGSGYLITAEKYIAIGVRVPGRIERFLVDEGDHVENGQLLAELDNRAYRAQAGRAEAALRRAAANRQLAESDRGRIRGLFRDGGASAQELD